MSDHRRSRSIDHTIRHIRAIDEVPVDGNGWGVEGFIGEVSGKDGVKLEQQVLITEAGTEILLLYPWDPRLLR